MTEATVSQLNIRMPTDLKDRGNETLALMGSSPARIIRKLWERLSEGGEAYRAVVSVLESDTSTPAMGEDESLVRASRLFEDMGSTLGLDPASFVPDTRSTSEMLEDIEWEQLSERGLA
jgi:predicted DNA-binding protein